MAEYVTGSNGEHQIRLRQWEVPTYLRNGDLFDSLDDDDDEPFMAPVSCTKPNESVDSSEDLSYLFRSISYWMVRSVPDTVANYVLTQGDLTQFQDIFPENLTVSHFELRVLKKICCDKPNNRIESAIFADCLNYVRLLHDSGHNIPYNACDHAALRGSIEILKYCFERLPDAKRNSKLCAFAANFECMRYLHEQGCDLSGAAEAAIRRGDMESLQYCVSHAKPSPLAFDYAAQYGQVECLRLLLRLPALANQVNSTWMTMAVRSAASNGHLQCLREMREAGVQFDTRAAQAAIEGNQVDCLEYVLSQGVAVTSALAHEAARHGSLPCLEYLHSVQCPWRSEACAGAASWGHLDCLTYLHEHGCPWDEETIRMAAMHGHLPCLQYAHQHGLSLAHLDLGEASTEGAAECIQYAIENGAPWNAEVRQEILEFGRPDCREYVLGLPIPLS